MTSEDMAHLHSRCFVTPRPWSAAEFADFLDQPACLHFSQDTGFVLGRAIADEAELLTLAVAPEHRQTGLGTQLTQAFLDGARDRGAERAFLEVAADNTAAIALYVKLGFTWTGTRSSYYRAPDGMRIDAHVMSRKIEQNSG